MDSQQTERRDGGCCDCASKQSTPAHLPRKMGSNARQSLRLRRVSLPLLARWRRPRSPLAGGGGPPPPGGGGGGGGHGGRGARTPHGQTEAAKRADGRSQGQTGACQKGSEPGMGADRSGQREEAPGTRADGKRGKNKKRAECWAHRNGQKARDQTHGQIETGKGHWRKLVTTY
jgi:hypothetical protein